MIDANETFRRIPSVHKPRGPSDLSPKIGDSAPRSGISKRSGAESQAQGAKAENSQATFRCPRPCRLECSFRFLTLLASEFPISNPLANNLTRHQREAIRIVQRIVFGRTVVIAEDLLIHVGIEVERLNGNVGATKTALQQRPKVLNTLSVDLAAHVFFD